MTYDDLRLSLFRSDLTRILGEIYAELAALRKEVRPARLYGEGRVEDLMELLAQLIADCEPREATQELETTEAAAAAGPRGPART